MKKFLCLGIAIVSLALAACQSANGIQDQIEITDNSAKTGDEFGDELENTPVGLTPVDTTVQVTPPQFIGPIDNELADGVQSGNDKPEVITQVEMEVAVASSNSGDPLPAPGFTTTATVEAANQNNLQAKGFQVFTTTDNDDNDDED